MDDKQLLERAAGAAGAKWVERPNHIDQWHLDGRPFNPLEDDGDAFRLAVSLNMVMDIGSDFSQGEVYAVANGDESQEVIVERLGQGNDCQATRRAIVRAAAALAE